MDWFDLLAVQGTLTSLLQHHSLKASILGLSAFFRVQLSHLYMTTGKEYTELYKKDLHDSDNHNGVITHLEPDILDCEIKWALGSITTNRVSGGVGIPVELFQILKDDALNIPPNMENSAVATGLEKVSFHSNPKERQCQRMLKLPHNCTHLTC